MNIGTLTSFLKLDRSQYTSGIIDSQKQAADMKGSLDKMERSTKSASTGMSDMMAVAGRLAGVFAGIGILNQVKNITLLAARNETLAIVMERVGANAGYTKREMEGLTTQLEKTGISTIEAKSNITKMAQAQLDLTKSSELARVAQDAAVIGNINSSEAFARMVLGIQTGQTEILRTIGINVSFEKNYRDLERTLGKTRDSLTEVEKAQARMNGVLEKGKDIAGVYEASMGTAGKQIQSLSRYTEDLKVSLGGMFLPSLTLLVEQFTEALKGTQKSLDDNKTSAQEWGTSLRTGIIDVEAEVIRLSMLLDKVGGTMTTLGAFATFGDTDKKFREWNKIYEERYKENEKQLQKLADRSVELEIGLVKQKLPLASTAKENKDNRALEAAAEALRIKTEAATKAAESLQKQWDKASQDFKQEMELTGLKGLELTLATITQRAAELRKTFGDKDEISSWEALSKQTAIGEEYERTLDRLIPLRHEQEQYNLSLAALEKMDPSKSTVEYTTALNALEGSLSKNVEAMKEYREETEKLDKLQEDYQEAMMASLPKEEQARIRLVKQYDEQRKAVENMQRAGKIDEDQATSIIAGLDEQEALAQATKQAGEFEEIWGNAVKNIQGAMADFLFDPFAEGIDGMLKGFGEMLKRMIAEAVAADLAKKLFGSEGGLGKTGGGDTGGGWVGLGLGLLSNMKSFDTGTDYVPNDMIAKIHKGERIIPAAENKGASNKQPIQITVNVTGDSANEVRRAAAQGARSALGALSGAQRFK